MGMEENENIMVLLKKIFDKSEIEKIQLFQANEDEFAVIFFFLIEFPYLDQEISIKS